MPKVSIVLPCYNGAKYLRASLDSVLNQTFTDWELIFVNDCSSDNSGDIATEYATRDKRIRVINNKTNKKLPGTLNVGFDVARGQYLTWTSDDNICKPNWLSTLVQYLDTHPSADMVSANTDLIDADGNVYGTLRKSGEMCTFRELAYKCNIGAAFMYRASIAKKIGKYDEDMFCAEDYDYWVRIALAGQIDYIPDNIYQYRAQPNSLTATQVPRVLAKTTAIQNKYRREWINKLKLSWWNRKKLEYLCRNFTYPRGEISLIGIRHILGIQIINILFCWNKSIRHKIKDNFRAKI